MLKVDVVDKHDKKMVLLFEGTFDQFKDVMLYSRDSFLQEEGTGYYVLVEQIAKFKQRG